MEVGVFQCLLKKKHRSYCGRYILFFYQSFNPFCHCSLLSLIFVMDPFFSFLGFGSTKEGHCAEGGGAKTGDREAGKDRDGISRIRGREFVQALEGSHITFPHVICPIPTQKCCHTPTASISKPPPQEPEETAPKASVPVARETELALEVPSSAASPALEGGYPCPHDTPTPAIGGVKRVYKCWVERCSEGPSISWATICAQGPFRGEVGMSLLHKNLP